MPELPEVETTRRGIAPRAIGNVVEGIDVYDRRLRWPIPDELERTLAGRRITRIDRRSKYLLFRCERTVNASDRASGRAAQAATDRGSGATTDRSDPPVTLLVHLGMTGSLRWHPKGRIPPRKLHDHVDIRFADGVLRYHDPRRFGAMLRLDDPVTEHPLLAALGPEPFTDEFNAVALHRKLKPRSAAIKLALMDNHVVVGVGNIYANEALFHAGIRPTRAANRVSRARLGKLVDSVRSTLEKAIDSGGSSLRDYVDGNGERGSFQLTYYAYGRAGLPCRVCGTTMKAARQGGRATAYCPRCQK